MEKRPTDLKTLFLLKVLSRRGGTMRFIRCWSFYNPLGNFFVILIAARVGVTVFVFWSKRYAPSPHFPTGAREIDREHWH